MHLPHGAHCMSTKDTYMHACLVIAPHALCSRLWPERVYPVALTEQCQHDKPC